ncbi:uncharacterized protein LOC135474081 [Liolophura sinensis]|uniref:uncharacterized protein LOC135474081 n=1 Tax=Liolophura sinensis TaxID=3198878 RepID=UPI0031596DC9
MACVCAVVRTNLDKQAITGDFLNQLSTYLVDLLKSNLQNTVLEVETGVAMLRAGTADPVVNISLHHNCDDLTKQTKQHLAGRMAEFIAHRLPVQTDRVLVLFVDTRKC